MPDAQHLLQLPSVAVVCVMTLLGGCTRPPPIPPPVPPPAPVASRSDAPRPAPEVYSLVYSDGSGNRHELDRQVRGPVSYRYAPITPERSSSGTYSGGAPWQGSLGEEQARRLRELLRQLEARTSLRVEDRAMGTGLFQLRDARGERRFVIRRGPELAELDRALAELRR